LLGFLKLTLVGIETRDYESKNYHNTFFSLDKKKVALFLLLEKMK